MIALGNKRKRTDIPRAGYENFIMPESNRTASSLQYPESGPRGMAACETSQSGPIAEAPYRAPLMFNVWSDIRM